MRKVLFALAILPLLVFMSCSSDDDDKDITPDIDFGYNIEWLYGEWRATEVELGKESIDLTDPAYEVMVAPTYVTFKKDNVYESEGVFGEGTGKYTTKDKKITTSLNDKNVSFDVKSLSATSAKIEIDVKDVDFGIPIPEQAGKVVVVLTKDYSKEIDFDFNIDFLYGKWRATAVEGVGDEPIDLTNPMIEVLVKPTYITFEEKGVYTSEGILGDGIGRYAVKGSDIATMINGNITSFEMEKLTAEIARIEIDAKSLDLPIIPEELAEVTVILTKQSEEEGE